LSPSYAGNAVSLHSRALDALYWVAGGRFAGQLVAWLVTIWVIRILAPADYGLMAMAMVFIAACALVDEFGLGAMITRAPALDEISVRKAFGIVLTINAALCGAFLAGAPAVAWFYGSDAVIPLVRLLALQFLGSALAVIPRALMERRLQFRRLASAELIVTLLGSFATLALALHGYGVWSLAAGTLAMTLGRAVLFNVLCPCPRRPLLSLRGMREFLAFGGTVSLERIVWYLYSQADVLIAAKLLGAHALGFYVVGKQLASLPAQKVFPIIQQVTFPVFARLQAEPGRVSRGLLQGVNAVSVFGCPIVFGMAALGEDLIVVILGPSWAPAALPLQTYGLIVPLGMISGMILSALKAVGRPELSLRNVASGAVFMALAFVVGSRWGLVGLSVAWVVAYPLYFLATVVRSAPALGSSAAAVVARIVRPLAAGAFMLAVVAALRASAADALGDGPGRLAALIVVGALGYGAAMAMLGRGALVEAVESLRRKRPSS
jgi:O-antigen/teichoic acid export membrane protein